MPNERIYIELKDKLWELNDRLIARIKPIGPIPARGVADRLCQKLSIQLSQSMAEISHLKLENESEINLPIVNWNLRKHTLTISNKNILIQSAKFVIIWFQVLLRGILFSSHTNSRKQTSLIYGIGQKWVAADNNYGGFISWAKEGPVKEVTNREQLVMSCFEKENEIKIQEKGMELVISLNPLYQIPRIVGMRISERILFLFKHLKNFTSFINAAIREPILWTIPRDFCELALIEVLDQKNAFDNISFTQGNMGEVPVWAYYLPNKKHETHMFWYSTNGKFHRKDPELGECYDPFWFFNYVDRHWVWCAEEKDWIKGIIKEDLHDKIQYSVCKPIVFANIQTDFDFIPYDKNNIVLFDLPPRILDPRQIYFNRYNNFEMIEKFLNDITQSAEDVYKETGNKLKIFLKTKKEISSYQEKRYQPFIEKFKKEGIIEIVPFNISVLNLIQNCEVTIAVPYSAPCQIALQLGRTGVHYDPTGELVRSELESKEINFIQNQETLTDFFLNHYK